VLGENAGFRWDNTIHGNGLRELKQMLSTAPVLQFYDFKNPLNFQCDASSNRISECILQNGKPIEYASRAMTRTERETYALIGKELLGIVFAMERSHTYFAAET
jgi:hypothetical protein